VVTDNKAEPKDMNVIVFFDEVNTSELVSGVFKEIMIDRHILGTRISDSIRFIGAINPYKKKMN
jgi:hypothetical protein